MPNFPHIELPDGREIREPHGEWLEHHVRWRWLLDSWEGGEAYRNGTYGIDSYGLFRQNLVRHKSEYPLPGVAPSSGYATDDDYEMRRARTPIPTFMAEAIETHLSKIFGREVNREGPPELKKWWDDVDGRGTSADDWMAGTIAPLLMVFGHLDILCDVPAVPDDEVVVSIADDLRLRLDTCLGSYILPENMVWWTVDRLGGYVECLYYEVGDDGSSGWRYWDAEGWILFDGDGDRVDGDTHPYGRVPIVRVFDRRRPRCRNIGLPRYEPVADFQREYYNRDSELILSDTIQAHPVVQGPEDFIGADQTVPMGPTRVLPKKKNNSGTTVTYEGFDVVEFPKGGAESIRLNKHDIRDSVDRFAMLTKPAGSAGTDASTVAQSGISKRLDAINGNDLLTKIATMLSNVERQIATLALCVLRARPLRPGEADAIKIQYPASFDLSTAEELAKSVQDFQAILSVAGEAPETEGTLLKKLIRLMLPGTKDDEFREMDKEIEDFLQSKVEKKEQAAEAGELEPAPPTNGQPMALAITVDDDEEEEGPE